MYLTILFFLCAIYYIFVQSVHRGHATTDYENGEMPANAAYSTEELFTPTQIMDLTFSADTSY